MSTKDGGPAFPITGTHEQVLEIGMTLRDYFAAKAMAAMLSGLSDSDKRRIASIGPDKAASMTGESAYVIADAMLKAREAC